MKCAAIRSHKMFMYLVKIMLFFRLIKLKKLKKRLQNQVYCLLRQSNHFLAAVGATLWDSS
jgi:hypothetical protein